MEKTNYFNSTRRSNISASAVHLITVGMMSETTRGIKKTKHPKAPRRPPQFWAPLNNWWRGYLAETGQRPVTSQVQQWFEEHSDSVWDDVDRPSWKETRIHAKCLRSTDQVKNYFREYRARNKSTGEERPSSRTVKVKVEPSQDSNKLGSIIAKHNARVNRISSLPAGSYDGGEESSSLTEGDDTSSEAGGPHREDSAEMFFPNKPSKISPFRVSSFSGIPGMPASRIPSFSSSFPAAIITTGGVGGGRTSSSTSMPWPPMLNGECAEVPLSELTRCYSASNPNAFDQNRSLVTGGATREYSSGRLIPQAADNKRRHTVYDACEIHTDRTQQNLASAHSLPVKLQPQDHRHKVGPVSDLEATWAACNASVRTAAAPFNVNSNQMGNHMMALNSAQRLQQYQQQYQQPQMDSHSASQGGFIESRSGSLPSGRQQIPDFHSHNAVMGHQQRPAIGQQQANQHQSYQVGGGFGAPQWPHSEDQCAHGGAKGPMFSRLARCSFGGQTQHQLVQHHQKWQEAGMQARQARPFSERGMDPNHSIATGIPVNMNAAYQSHFQQHCQHQQHLMQPDPLHIPSPLCFEQSSVGSLSREGHYPKSADGAELESPHLGPQLQRLRVSSGVAHPNSFAMSRLEQQRLQWEREGLVPQPEMHAQQHQQQGSGSWLQQVWMKENAESLLKFPAAETPAPVPVTYDSSAREHSSSGTLLIEVPAPLSSDSATTSCASDSPRIPSRHQSQQHILQHSPSVNNGIVEGSSSKCLPPRPPTVISCAPVLGYVDGGAMRVRGLSDGFQEDPMTTTSAIAQMDWEQHEEEALMTAHSWLLGDLL